MAEDILGLTVTTDSSEAVEAWNAALFDFLEARLSLGQRLKDALEADPDFVPALCFRGYFLMQLSSVQTLPKVAEILVHAKKCAKGASERERMHVAALEHWHKGNAGKACGVWEEILDQWPQDLLALRLHHFTSFWRGDRAALREAPAAVLGRIDEKAPGRAFVLGMVAFGLEESGDYARAETFGREAVERNENDLWALHAVAHVLEMQCRHSEGAKLLEQPFGTWSDRNPFKDHVWWHAALFALEMGDHARVLEVYDREVRADEGGFYLDVQNAASLLQRLELDGADAGARWEELADLAEGRIGDHVIPFTDAHFMLALIGARRFDAARRYLASLKAFASSGKSDASRVTRDVTVPLAEALLAYGEGRYGEAADGLYGLRRGLAPLGGSHAQQDVFHQTLIDAMMRSGRKDTARSLLAERRILRPGSGWARDRLAALD